MSENNNIPVSRESGSADSPSAGVKDLFLSPHVHICVADDHAILLDLKRDKYVGVTPNQMKVLAGRVRGWPAGGTLHTPILQTSGTGAAAIVDRMLEVDILTRDPLVGKEAIPISLPRLECSLTVPDLETRPRITAANVVRFLYASAFARLSLKWRPIEKVVARVEARKKKRAPAGTLIDPEAVRQQVDAFLYLRPLFFTVKDACLFDSLALVEYMAGYGYYPEWLIGVQTTPFRAHSWVQNGTVVFNDTPDYVRRFAPILSI